VLRPLSKSTKTFEDHSRCCSSSRVTTSPARSTSACNTCSGFPCNRSLTPCLRSSPVRRSNSKTPNRTILRALGVPLLDSVVISQHHRVRREEGATSYHEEGTPSRAVFLRFLRRRQAIREVGPGMHSRGRAGSAGNQADRRPRCVSCAAALSCATRSPRLSHVRSVAGGVHRIASYSSRETRTIKSLPTMPQHI